MVDKNYCMSSYLVFRYIIDDDKDFFLGKKHRTYKLVPDEKRVLVHTAQDIDREIRKQFENVKNRKLGLLLSGGMDSACLASYMPGQEAYTFRFMGGNYQRAELKRAEYFAQKWGLNLHYVDIDWAVVEKNVDKLMQHKNSPLHSIEPQIEQAALMAKADGVDLLINGDGADAVFGGMDGLLSKDWTYDEFKKRYTYLDPTEILNAPVDMNLAFEKYRLPEGMIDYMGFMAEYDDIESYASYENAFSTAGMPYLDPYEILKMAEPLDLYRVRHGESKYLIRQLFKMKYPEVPVPEKLPMPRPVDTYFRNWEGPKRLEFKQNLDMSRYTGNQKWQMWCLERYLNNNEK